MKLEELDSQLEQNQLSGFWRTRVPGHAAEAPYLWKWEPLLDGLLKASETIGIEQADRILARIQQCLQAGAIGVERIGLAAITGQRGFLMHLTLRFQHACALTPTQQHQPQAQCGDNRKCHGQPQQQGALLQLRPSQVVFRRQVGDGAIALGGLEPGA